MLIRIISLVFLFVATGVSTAIHAEDAYFVYPKKKPSVFKKINKKILPLTKPKANKKPIKINKDFLLPKDKPVKEKEKIIVEKKKERDVAKKQKRITTIKFLGKTLPELIKEFGIPDLTREDGNTKTVRYDTLSCRLFLYFNSTINISRVEHYEIRDTKGNLINRSKDLEKCFHEIQKV